MAKRPLKKKEDIEAVPLDQDVELDLSADDDPVVVVTNDGDKKEPPKKTNGHEPPPAVQAEDDAAALRKQLDDLRAAENARNAELQRQVDEANRRAQELEQQSSQHQNQQLEAEYDSVLNAIAASESEANAAQAAYEKAAELGDYKAMGEAQRKISRAEARLESLDQGKAALEARREAAKTASPKKDATNQDPFEQAIAQLPDAAKTWLRGHRDYMTDQRKNIKIQAAHFEVLDEGVQAYSPEYFESIETKLGLRQKKVTTDDDDNPDPEPPARRAPVSAPVSREVASPSTGRSTPTKITLTAEEREMARLSMPDTDPGEAEKIYAQNKLKLQQLKNSGHYSER